VFIDMAIFALIFLVFMLERVSNFASYESAQHHLNALFGLFNTLVLLTSSWCVVEAVHCARRRAAEEVATRLTFALLLGFLFVLSKFIEYRAKIMAGIGPATNPFFSFYFFITFVHFLHVVAGMLVINIFRRRAESCRDSKTYTVGLENLGLFWHYVDILWIFIFPVLYLI
jgi:nitric oxide reductase NorE protein